MYLIFAVVICAAAADAKFEHENYVQTEGWLKLHRTPTNWKTARLVCFEEDEKFYRHDYEYYPDAQGWLKLNQVPATWYEARLTCAQEGSVLASPEDEQMSMAIRTSLKALQRSSQVFTGVHATYAKGYYYSIQGTPLTRMPVRWADGEPNNAGNREECLAMMVGGQMADVNCAEPLPFVCYKRKTTEMRCANKEYELDRRSKSCYKFHTEKKDWASAFATCSAEGGYLAIINSETEAQVLKQLYERTNASQPHIYQSVLLGYTDWHNHNTWMTIHGQTLKEAGYDTWGRGQPDENHRPVVCGGMLEDALLDDLPCHEHRIFMCEMDPQEVY